MWPLYLGAAAIAAYFFLTGTGGSATGTGGSARSLLPTGKAWPAGVTTDSARHAVQIALVVETESAKLRAFANVIDSYDPESRDALNAQAAHLEILESGTVSVSSLTVQQALGSGTFNPYHAGYA